MKREFGVTLIELMVAISVLAILASVAVPSYNFLVTNNRMTAQSNRLLATLLYARNEAAKRGASVSICRTDDPAATTPACSTTTGGTWSNGWISFVDVDADGSFDSGADTLLKAEPAIESGTLKSSDFVDVVRYDPEGRSNDQGEFTFCPKDNDSRFTRTVDISPSGRPRVTKEGTCS